MKGVQCYELFGGIALKIRTFSFFHFHFIDFTEMYLLFFHVKFERQHFSLMSYGIHVIIFFVEHMLK